MDETEAWEIWTNQGTIPPGFADVIAERMKRRRDWDRNPEPR